MSSDQNQDSHQLYRNYDDDFPPLNRLADAPLPMLPSIHSLLGSQRSRGSTTNRPPSSRPMTRATIRSDVGRRNPATSSYARARPPGQTWEEGNAHANLRYILSRSRDPSPGLSFVPGMASTASTHRPHDLQEDSRRPKRRKVDSDRLVPDFDGFRYGTYGQVEPGPLKMEIVSCDGGMFLNELSYSAENILKNDGSVYCTKGNRCNIVLRHQGATVFNLTELVIKAPSSNYSSPVREGLVFVSMHHDDRLLRTSQYQIPYRAQQTRHTSDDDGRIGGRDTRPAPPVMTMRRRDGTVELRRRNSLFSLGLDDDDDMDENDDDMEEDEDDDDDQEDYRLAQVPREFATASLPPFNVTMECSDDEALDSSFRMGRNAPNRIGSLPFESDDSEDGYNNMDEPFFDDFHTFGFRDMSTPPEDPEPVAAAHEPGRGSGGDLMVPHARFNIEKGRSKCTIHFDPPISGRFILLKMWSPRQHAGSNIDIQSVVARGFAGPRYFPSITLA